MDISSISSTSAEIIDYHSKRMEAALKNLSKDGVVVQGAATKEVVSINNSPFESFLNGASLESKIRTISANVGIKHNPEHPSADNDGNVKVYDMNQSELVTEALESYRMYETNIRALGLYNKMILKSFEIGK
jgi:flagellar basal-body rod protein FlgC